MKHAQAKKKLQIEARQKASHASFRSGMPKLTSVIKFLESASRALESPKSESARNSGIMLLSQAGLTTRAIAEHLADHGYNIHQTTIARIIRSTAPELPL
jgi:hypothetical protein